jgi:hypothetical protein
VISVHKNTSLFAQETGSDSNADRATEIPDDYSIVVFVENSQAENAQKPPKIKYSSFNMVTFFDNKSVSNMSTK